MSVGPACWKSGGAYSHTPSAHNDESSCSAMELKRNVGTFDVAARVVAGGVLMIVANHGHWAAGVAGAVLSGCAAVRWCPLWWALRVDTGAVEKTYRGAAWPDDEGD